MKYILKKDLPLAKAGIEVDVCRYGDTDEYSVAIYLESEFHTKHIADIGKKDIPEWLEEVKEPKTIYDLKKGDTFWTIENCGYIQNGFIPFDYFEGFLDITRCFVTEREAKRNKLLRELATRTDKWLPEKGDQYYSYHLAGCDGWSWQGDNTDMIKYHSGLVFRNEEEYYKWMTPEVKDLLFNI